MTRCKKCGDLSKYTECGLCPLCLQIQNGMIIERYHHRLMYIVEIPIFVDYSVLCGWLFQ